VWAEVRAAHDVQLHGGGDGERARGGGKEIGAEAAEPVSHAAQVLKEMREQEEAAVAQRIIHIDPELAAAVEAESWAGPVKPKENLWDMPHKLKMERESFLHAARPKPAGTGRLQKMA
jgi:hypothetical protein